MIVRLWMAKQKETNDGHVCGEVDYVSPAAAAASSFRDRHSNNGHMVA
jgi:hypothetical protein